MTRADELLLSCLRRDPSDAKLLRLKDFAPEDWEEILPAALQYSVAPLLFDSLKPLFPRLNVPDAVQQALHGAYYQSAVRNMRLYKKLLETIAAFNANNTSVILLKGAHLAEAVYGNIALRPMSDADVLARREDLTKVDKLLTELRYRRSPDDEQGCALEHLAPYTKSDAANIEVHFHITEPPFSKRFDPAVLWERAQKQVFQGVEVLTLCPEDLLMHLCVHTCIHHGFDNGITPFIDIACVMEHYKEKIDWEECVKHSRERGVDRCVYLMLALTEKLLGQPMPAGVCQGTRPDKGALEAVTAAEELVFEKGPGVPAHIARLFSEGWRSRVRYFLLRAFPPKDDMRIQAEETGGKKAFSLFWHYVLRWRGIFKRHGKTIWAGMRKEPQTMAALELQKKRNRLVDWLKSSA